MPKKAPAVTRPPRAQAQCKQVLKRLRAHENPKAVAGMARYGINPDRTLGVSIPTLRNIAREIGVDHELARELWASGVHEARILATLIDDPLAVTRDQMEQWAKDVNSWDVCDQACNNLFRRTRHAYRKAAQWSSRKQDYVKRAGFVLMATLAVHDTGAEEDVFEAFLGLVEREAWDERNVVKKAVNWALRQIGKRSPSLNRKAIETARAIGKQDSAAARWIASDALRELTSAAVQTKVKKGPVKREPSR